MKQEKQKNFKQGFTLLELLVAVLIIGILASIAIPQYNIAIAKARTSTILPLLKRWADAQNVYFLANGEFADDSRKLDLDIPDICTVTSDGSGTSWVCGTYFYVAANTKGSVTASYCPGNNESPTLCIRKKNRHFHIRFAFWEKNAEDYDATQEGLKPNEILCVVDNNSKLGEKVCKSIGF